MSSSSSSPKHKYSFRLQNEFNLLEKRYGSVLRQTPFCWRVKGRENEEFEISISQGFPFEAPTISRRVQGAETFEPCIYEQAIAYAPVIRIVDVIDFLLSGKKIKAGVNDGNNTGLPRLDREWQQLKQCFKDVEKTDDGGKWRVLNPNIEIEFSKKYPFACPLIFIDGKMADMTNLDYRPGMSLVAVIRDVLAR